MDSEHPHLVVRLMPAVYSRVPLEVSGDDYVDGVLKGEARERLIEEGRDFLRTKHFRCCVVFGPRDCVFIERGHVRASTEAPSGWSEIRLASPDAREPSWTTVFRRSTIGEHIWRCRWKFFYTLVDAAATRGVTSHIHTDAWTEVGAWAFLDGGLLISRRHVVGQGILHGNWIIGDQCLRWACSALDLTPPRRLADVTVPETLVPGRLSSDALAVDRADRLRALLS